MSASGPEMEELTRSGYLCWRGAPRFMSSRHTRSLSACSLWHGPPHGAPRATPRSLPPNSRTGRTRAQAATQDHFVATASPARHTVLTSALSWSCGCSRNPDTDSCQDTGTMRLSTRIDCIWSDTPTWVPGSCHLTPGRFPGTRPQPGFGRVCGCRQWEQSGLWHPHVARTLWPSSSCQRLGERQRVPPPGCKSWQLDASIFVPNAPTSAHGHKARRRCEHSGAFSDSCIRVPGPGEYRWGPARPVHPMGRRLQEWITKHLSNVLLQNPPVIGGIGHFPRSCRLSSGGEGGRPGPPWAPSWSA